MMIQFGLDDEQQQLRDVVRSALSARAPLASVRSVVFDGEGFDRGLWAELSGQMGLTSLTIPEQYGGSGYTFVEQAVVLEEMGRVAYPGPYMSTAVLAPQVLLAAADESVRSELLPRLASGEVIATVAANGSTGIWSTGFESATFDGQRLSGVKIAVPDAARADVIIATATGPSGPCLVLVETTDSGLHLEVEESLDPGRPVANLRFEGAGARLISGSGDVLAAVELAYDVIAVGVACEQVGVAGAALAMATEYAQARKQFDRPIGSFQAIKHMLADVYMDNESAWSAAYYGAWVVGSSRSELSMVAPLASAFAADAAVSAVETNIQVHGGIGFTWEHDAHFLVRRAFASRQLVSPPDRQRGRIASALLTQ
jgi:alkylation response protein AidB-like acyl-CoA dehydrogenase